MADVINREIQMDDVDPLCNFSSPTKGILSNYLKFIVLISHKYNDL